MIRQSSSCIDPLPNITATLDELAGAKWFTSFDLVSGYYQFEVLPEDREITVFMVSSSTDACHLVSAMPPSTFQRDIYR